MEAGVRSQKEQMPPRPGALAQEERFWLRLQEERVTVQEGQCVLVPCNVSYPKEHGPAYGYWYRDKGECQGTQGDLVATNDPNGKVHETQTPQRFHLLGGPWNDSCSLDIRDTRRGDTGTYYFRVERGGHVRHNYCDQRLSVNVTALTHRPDIHLQGPLQSGRPRNITCAAPWACERETPPTFSWTGVGLGATSTDSPVLTLSPGPQHHGSNLTCRVTFPAVNVSTETTVRLSVGYAPQNLTIQVIREEGSGPEALGNGSSLPVQEGQSLRLACVVHSSPPTNLTWVWGSQMVKSSPSLHSVGAVGTWEHPQTLELELARVRLEDHGKLLCCAENPLGSQEASLSLSVERAPGTWMWFILGAVGGAGVSALLGFCLGILMVPGSPPHTTPAPLPKQALARSSPTAVTQPQPCRPHIQGHQGGSWADSPPRPQGPAEAPSEEEQELHYANLAFLKASTRAFLVQETPEYAEVTVRHGAALS
ncbi:sialic acid-binding Ig-like lectin 13 [Talpa occidentalis]|uniref:sialic acid-binding Ig-like lectin 13 n=1 Tax=Talpa occidentalis TaxID=50954 RepID=UPI00188EFC08|nr:sialic acid-binding Ig-like lectin 13 [Talpa occidentalis]